MCDASVSSEWISHKATVRVPDDTTERLKGIINDQISMEICASTACVVGDAYEQQEADHSSFVMLRSKPLCLHPCKWTPETVTINFESNGELECYIEIGDVECNSIEVYNEGDMLLGRCAISNDNREMISGLFESTCPQLQVNAPTVAKGGERHVFELPFWFSKACAVWASKALRVHCLIGAHTQDGSGRVVADSVKMSSFVPRSGTRLRIIKINFHPALSLCCCNANCPHPHVGLSLNIFFCGKHLRNGFCEYHSQKKQNSVYCCEEMSAFLSCMHKEGNDFPQSKTKWTIPLCRFAKTIADAGRDLCETCEEDDAEEHAENVRLVVEAELEASIASFHRSVSISQSALTERDLIARELIRTKAFWFAATSRHGVPKLRQKGGSTPAKWLSDCMLSHSHLMPRNIPT